MDYRKPVYLLAGGRPKGRTNSDPLIQAVFRESGVESPTVAYVGTASDDDGGFFKMIAGFLRGSGAYKVEHALISPKKADINKAKDILQSADIIFISGGDVELGMQVLQEKNMIQFLSQFYQQGKLFFGASAGSIMLAKEWIRWRDPDDDSTAELFPCLGFAPVICDTHDEQGGWEELQAALALEKDNTRGYGIASGTAIKVFPDGRTEAMGGAVYQYIRQGGKVSRISDILPANNIKQD